MAYIGLDFETYSAVNLPKHGLARYVGDKSFMPLIGSVAQRGHATLRLDFVNQRRSATRWLENYIGGDHIVAHNAPFEQAVLSHLGLDYPSTRFVDSAVVARVAGAGGRLEAAAPQLLGTDKMPEGRKLIQLFCVPGEYQEKAGSPLFDPQIMVDRPQEWSTFGDYCDLDAELGLNIALDWASVMTSEEYHYAAVTQDMNATGWCVDVPMVEEMQRRYLENQEQALFDFRSKHNAADLNLNSLKQLKEWCADRGIKATSFDEKHVESLIVRIEKKLRAMLDDDPKYQGYDEVLELLKTKQILGGSSLKKLQVILDTAIEDTWNPGRYRLKDQYLHAGAGQTLRTTGRSVQMQNLKRLKQVADMDELLEVDSEWNNTQLAENLRQVFTATDPNGRLIVGDFSSVESRGLAWLAGEQWKLTAYRQDKGVYEMLAARMFGVPYESIDKKSPERQAGKVGELSCGYGAGAGAVQSFAASMGIEMSEGEAAKLVYDWRDADPKTVELWQMLDIMLHNVVEDDSPFEKLHLPDGLVLELRPVYTPSSLAKQHPRAQSVEMAVRKLPGGGGGHSGLAIMRRVFHGCYVRGKNVSYYKPSDRKTGDLWKRDFIDPKTKQRRFYELYGGKLAGILTQSFCRELFFESLLQVHDWCGRTGGQVQLVGQFHDEIVLDWKPGALDLDKVKYQLGQMMSHSQLAGSFPLAAEIKDDYRYTK